MNFASMAFLLFFAAFLPVYLLCKPQPRLYLLLCANWFFYAWYKPPLLALLLATTALDFAAGLWLERLRRPAARKLLLVASVTVNLGVLFFFKYAAFAASALNGAFQRGGLAVHLPVIAVLLPLGISFYTFHSISYMADIHLGRIRAERDFRKYALYVCFFPLLVAGPIERASHLLPQFHGTPRPFDAERFLSGLGRMILGFWKKLVIADALAFQVARAYAFPEDHSGGTLLFATYAFAFQIYCDFSGYSDIALGAARMLGFDLKENFRAPYFAATLTDFWRRWHISLSTWLRDYLYIPLGGSRGGLAKTCLNLVITMALGGLWHGAAWTFILWGVLHGLVLAAEKLLGLPDRLRAIGGRSPARGRLARVLARILVFHVVCLGWVFFRAQDLHDAFAILSRIADPGSLFRVEINDRSMMLGAWPQLALLLGFEALRGRIHGDAALARWRALRSPVRVALASAFHSALLLAIVLWGVEAGSRFIYFQF
jgi:D-alanyl-lipoteichoic acid acyltransferase DltB (MBOAT superfamily)